MTRTVATWSALMEWGSGLGSRKRLGVQGGLPTYQTVPCADKAGGRTGSGRETNVENSEGEWLI